LALPVVFKILMWIKLDSGSDFVIIFVY